MTEQQVDHSLQTNKLRLNFWDNVSHYSIVGFLSLIPLTVVFFHLRYLLNSTPKPIGKVEIHFIIIPILLALLHYKLQSDRLKFKEVFTTLSRQQLHAIIEKVGNELKWHPQEINKNLIIAKTHPSFFSGSWGEQITIIFDTNRVLVNSICDPDKTSSVVSMGRNKKNENKLIKEIETASR